MAKRKGGFPVKQEAVFFLVTKIQSPGQGLRGGVLLRKDRVSFQKGGLAMKGAILTMVACFLLVAAGTAFADNATITITKLGGQPPNWNPDENPLDQVLTEIGKTTEYGTMGTDAYRFHVGIPGGMDDLHIDVTEGQGVDGIDLTQVPPKLFPNQDVAGLHADMWGTNVPFCTYFTLQTDVSISLTPTPEPTTLSLLALGGLALRRRRR